MIAKSICLAILSSLLCPFAPAQWIPTSKPYGGHVYCLAVKGATHFAGTYDGAYRSTDGGTNWTSAYPGPTYPGVFALAVSGTNFFAGTQNGVFLSNDGGTSWTPVTSGFTYTAIWSLAFSGTNLFAGTDSGVSRSTDNGSSWTQASVDLPQDREVGCFAVSGTNLFAGGSRAWLIDPFSSLYGVFLSTDNGTSCTQASPGQPQDFFVDCLTVSGVNIFSGGSAGAFLSNDNGASWTAINEGLPRYTGDTQQVAVQCVALSGSNLFAGTYDGVFRSTDHGASWTQASVGLPQFAYVVSFAVSGTNLIALTSGGVFRSTDSCTKWTAANEGLASPGLPVTDVSSLAVFRHGSLRWDCSPRRLETTVVGDDRIGGRCLRFRTRDVQTYPNPSNPTTKITWQLSESGFVTLRAYNVLGREVTTLVNENLQPGNYERTFDATGLANGVCFYRLGAAEFTNTK